MKKLFFILLLIIGMQNVVAQDLKTLKSEAQKVYKASTTLDFEVIFETTYPKIFEIASKEDLKKAFHQILDNEEFSIQLLTVNPNFEFGKLLEIEDRKFCVIKHDNFMRLKFKNKVEEPEFLIEIFKTSMNADEVFYNKELDAFDIKMRSTLVAISDTLTQHQWKFINKGADDFLLREILSEDVILKLGL